MFRSEPRVSYLRKSTPVSISQSEQSPTGTRQIAVETESDLESVTLENILPKADRPSAHILSDGRHPPHAERRDSESFSEAEEEYLRKMLSERRASFRPQPKQTVPYLVQPSDTLEGIAIRYDITPSELVVLNKLTSRVVFPGQTIYIPEKNSLKALEQIFKDNAAIIASSSSSEEDSPKPGHVERVPGGSAGDKNAQPKEEATKDNFSELECFTKEKLFEGAKESLRVNSKYVTDGEGVVNGILIVTTNHIIFDPNVSDPLVLEYGMEKYGVEAPMGCIVRAALYTDIFRMKIKDTNAPDAQIGVYHSKNLNLKKSKSHHEQLTSKADKPPHRSSAVEAGSRRSEFGLSISNSFQENLSKICESTDTEEEDPDGSPAPDILQLPELATVQSETEHSTKKSVPSETEHSTKKSLDKTCSLDSEESVPSRKASMSDEEILSSSEGSKKKSNFEKTKNRLHKGLRKLSITDSLFSHPQGGRRMSLPAFTSLPDFKAKNLSSKTPGDKLKAETEKATPAVYVNMVDEKPELFAPVDSPTNLDILDENLELIPRPAKSFCDTPLYLCLRMGNPINKSLQSNCVIRFGHKMKQEYWFSIPKDSVDDLYFFFLRWCPEKYGDIDKIDLEALGYLPIEPEASEEPEEKSVANHRRASWAFPWRRKSKENLEIPSAPSPEGWEFLDYLGAKKETIEMPELLTPSNILKEDQLLEINKHLPPRAMNQWEMIYGTAVHGFSLKTMYRAMTKYDSPVLLVICNSTDVIFGALLSSPLRLSDHFYGTGESFLFTFYPEFKVYHWSGENDYFIKGNVDSLFIGSSEGHFGLWLDDDLFHGRTNSCQTFSNEPLCPEEDFEIKSLEAWGFI